MEHVALELVAHLVPCEHIVGLDDILAGAAFDRIEMDECFVRNHAGQRETVGRCFAFVVVAAVEVRVVLDREDLLEKDQAVEHRGFESRCDGDHIANALGKAGGKGERNKAADRWANDRMQRANAKLVEQEREGMDLIGGGHGRKRGTPVAAGFRIDRSRPGAAITAAEIVGANDKMFVGIDCLAGADHVFPPTGVQFLLP